MSYPQTQAYTYAQIIYTLTYIGGGGHGGRGGGGRGSFGRGTGIGGGEAIEMEVPVLNAQARGQDLIQFRICTAFQMSQRRQDNFREGVRVARALAFSFSQEISLTHGRQYEAKMYGGGRSGDEDGYRGRGGWGGGGRGGSGSMHGAYYATNMVDVRVHSWLAHEW